jgi:hypothetical protein
VRLLPVISTALLAACSARDDIPAPLIASIVPDHATPGSIVTVDGSYFCQDPSPNPDDPTCAIAGTVQFGTVPGTPTTWADDAIMVEVPQQNGTVTVTVTAVGRTSNGVAFTVQ